jgi:uncharacterized protein involved in type VI secretion and phage assembly
MSLLELAFESKEDSLSVRRFALHEGMSSLFSVSVWARSPNDDLDLETIVGKKAELRVASGMAHAFGGGARRWTGICQQMEHVDTESTGLSMYYLRIAPTLWLLTQRTNHRLFQHESISGVVGKLLAEWQIEPVWKIDRGAYPKLELRIQYGESDFAFLSRLLEEAGISYFFAEDEKKGSELVLSDAPQSIEARAGGPLPFVDNPNQAAEKEFVSQVRLSRDVRPGKVTLRDHDFRRKSDAKLLGAAQHGGGGVEDRLEIYRYRPGLSLVEMEESAAKKLDQATGGGGGLGKKIEDSIEDFAKKAAEKGIEKLDAEAQKRLHGVAKFAEHEAAGLALAGVKGGVKGVIQKAEQDIDGLVKKAEEVVDQKITGIVKGELGKLAGGVVGDLAGELVGDLAGNIAGKIAGKIGSAVKGQLDRLAGDDKGFARHDEKAAQKRSQMQLEGVRATKFSVNFSTNALDLAPGAVFSMMDHPRSSLAPDKRLLVTEFMIEGTNDGEWDMMGHAVFADQPYRPLAVMPKPTVHGAQSAVVVGPKGEEIHTDELGRVRVQFHWDREGGHDENSSCWMRVSQGWAGAGYGMITIPRVGQEVLVGFLEGDPDLPMVTGTAFSTTSRVPHPLPAHKTRSSWRGVSSPGGDGANEIMMDDAKGKELIYQLAERNMQHIVKKDRGAVVGEVDSILVGKKYSMHVAQGAVPPPKIVATGIEVVDRKITFTTGEASITLEGPNVTIEAKGVITVKSKGDDVIIKGGPNVKINCEEASIRAKEISSLGSGTRRITDEEILQTLEKSQTKIGKDTAARFRNGDFELKDKSEFPKPRGKWPTSPKGIPVSGVTIIEKGKKPVVYIDHDQPLSFAASTLVHEGNHALNSTSPYSSQIDILKNELRAYNAEYRYNYGVVDMVDYKRKETIEMIIRQYNLVPLNPQDFYDLKPEGMY